MTCNPKWPLKFFSRWHICNCRVQELKRTHLFGRLEWTEVYFMILCTWVTKLYTTCIGRSFVRKSTCIYVYDTVVHWPISKSNSMHEKALYVSKIYSICNMQNDIRVLIVRFGPGFFNTLYFSTCVLAQCVLAHAYWQLTRKYFSNKIWHKTFWDLGHEVVLFFDDPLRNVLTRTFDRAGPVPGLLLLVGPLLCRWRPLRLARRVLRDLEVDGRRNGLCIWPHLYGRHPNDSYDA